MNKLTCPVCSAELDLDEYHEKLLCSAFSEIKPDYANGYYDTDYFVNRETFECPNCNSEIEIETDVSASVEIRNKIVTCNFPKKKIEKEENDLFFVIDIDNPNQLFIWNLKI